VPIRVLLDTNVWVSAFINPHGRPAQIIEAWLDSQFQVVVSLVLLDELADVLARPRIRTRYGLDTAEIVEFLQLLSARAITVTPTGQIKVCRDPDDDLILEAAILGKAQYLVSRDDDLKRDTDLVARMEAYGVMVLSVEQFFQKINSAPNALR
jgi:putative PIN family toxin of toxin-antitoxin system